MFTTFNLQMQEPGRLFCPHCGNATLDKVELTIGPDGTEQYGVRKRFNTRGTRFSLPKPKVTTLHTSTVRQMPIVTCLQSCPACGCTRLVACCDSSELHTWLFVIVAISHAFNSFHAVAKPVDCNHVKRLLHLQHVL